MHACMYAQQQIPGPPCNTTIGRAVHEPFLYTRRSIGVSGLTTCGRTSRSQFEGASDYRTRGRWERLASLCKDRERGRRGKMWERSIHWITDLVATWCQRIFLLAYARAQRYRTTAKRLPSTACSVAHVQRADQTRRQRKSGVCVQSGTCPGWWWQQRKDTVQRMHSKICPSHSFEAGHWFWVW